MYGISGGWLNHTESRDHQQKGAWFPLHSSPWAGPFANENLCPCIYVGYFLNVTLGGEAKLMVLYGHPITLIRANFTRCCGLEFVNLVCRVKAIRAVFLPRALWGPCLATRIKLVVGSFCRVYPQAVGLAGSIKGLLSYWVVPSHW